MAVSDNSDGNGCAAHFEDISETVDIEMKVCVTNSQGVIQDTCSWTSGL